MPGGRPLDTNGLYAKELGISRRRVMRYGGAAKMKALSPEALAVLMGPQGSNRKNRSLKALGMTTGKSKRNR